MPKIIPIRDYPKIYYKCKHTLLEKEGYRKVVIKNYPCL